MMIEFKTSKTSFEDLHGIKCPACGVKNNCFAEEIKTGGESTIIYLKHDFELSCKCGLFSIYYYIISIKHSGLTYWYVDRIKFKNFIVFEDSNKLFAHTKNGWLKSNKTEKPLQISDELTLDEKVLKKLDKLVVLI